MPTANLGLSTPAHGSNVDSWDADPINNNSGILDSKFGVIASIALTNANVTLNATQYQSSVLRFSGTLTGNCIITLPAVSLMYAAENLCTGAFNINLTCGAGQNIALPPGECVNVFSDGTNVKFKDLGRVGSYLDYAGPTVPAWVSACAVPPYLLCDGSTFSAVTYPALATILGTTTLPDYRGRARFYLNGGTGRITTAGSGIDGDTRFVGGGAQNVTVSQANLPAATLATTIVDPGHPHNFAGASFSGATAGNSGTPIGTLPISATLTTATATTGITASTALGGSGTALNEMPPAAIGGVTMIRAA